jgi:L-seryl-tRNA(Ser) seleniumtransferase
MHRLLGESSIAGYVGLLGPAAVKAEVDGVLEGVRAGLDSGARAVPPFEAIVGAVRDRLVRLEYDGLLEVLNATGIVLHTNLGRAPLAQAALDAMAAIGGGYSNLEFDLARGERGTRYRHVTELLRQLTGAEDALVVNNCAAAVLLALDALAKDREVVVARGGLIEIGGGFRLPEVLERSGATLVEVGATNKVYVKDYERALTPRTALLFLSHRSNFSLEGFVADVAAADLAALGRRAGVAVIEDLGSGALVDLAGYGLPHERTVPEAVADGVDLVAFSGDKLLGGPQAGILVGKTATIARLRAAPMLRALRVDKATLAGLAATLRLYLEPDGVRRIPLYAMLGQSVERLRERAGAIAGTLGERGARTRVIDSEAFAGGGAAPRARLPSVALAIRPPAGDPNALAARLRLGRPPIVGRTLGDEVLLDLRTVSPERDGEVGAALARALA